MNTKKLAARVASTAVVAFISITTLSAVASAGERPAARTDAGTGTVVTRTTPNAWSSRLSGLPSGGAALFDGVTPDYGSPFYDSPATLVRVKQVAPNAWSPRLSGLPFGGAALYI
jgi:hypothetical protein